MNSASNPVHLPPHFEPKPLVDDREVLREVERRRAELRANVYVGGVAGEGRHARDEFSDWLTELDTERAYDFVGDLLDALKPFVLCTASPLRLDPEARDYALQAVLRVVSRRVVDFAEDQVDPVLVEGDMAKWRSA
jgi:hypothetical protein